MRKLFIIALISMAISAFCENAPKQEVNLRGKWLFEVGDHPDYAKPDFDDSSWEKIRVPDKWEDQGFPGYDGYAWYRKKFHLSDRLKNKILMLHLGYIDDVDRVYINGQFINGRGNDSPNYVTAYNQRRYYEIPHHVLNFDGENVIAVKVYDDWGEGGIVSGKIGIYSQNSVGTIIDLSGNWKFNNGDNLDWADMNYDDQQWETLIVPAPWESQNHWNIDGYGWYRNRFIIPESMSKENLILYIGAIDDADELYMNGIKIGHTGQFPGENFKENNRRFYNYERVYYIPNEVIKWGKENVVAIRVYDAGGEGGIVRGPIGIISRKEYRNFRKSYRKQNFNFPDFLDNFLD